MRVKLRRPESRRRPRTKVNWPVVVELGDRVLHGETIDVGQFGVKVRLEDPLEDASLVTLHLNPPQGCPVDAQAIVWRTDDDGPVFLFLKKTPAVLLAGNDKHSPAPRGLTILVVDDDPSVGSLARDILGYAEYLVLFTDDPVEAIRLARQRPGDIDLLTVDVVMPLMDGRELARRVLDLDRGMHHRKETIIGIRGSDAIRSTADGPDDPPGHPLTSPLSACPSQT